MYTCSPKNIRFIKNFADLSKDFTDNKIYILDIYATIDSNISCDIEMQVVNQNNIEARLIYYWSLLFSKSIKSGQNYDELKKAIVILIADFKFKKTSKLEKYMSKWNIREVDYPEIILTDLLEIYIIELLKFKENKNISPNSSLNSWVKFIKNPEVINMNNHNKAINAAKEILEEISQDEHEQYLAHLREKYILDQKNIEYLDILKDMIKV